MTESRHNTQLGRYAAIYAAESETWLYPRTAGLHAVLVHLLDPYLGPGNAILDVGCGAGRLSLYCARRGADVTGIDFAPAAIELARMASEMTGTTARFSTERIEDKAGQQFDLILAIGVLEHVEDPPAVLSTLARVLRVSGLLCVACPGFSNLRGWSYLTLARLFGWPMSLADLWQVDQNLMDRWSVAAGLRCERTVGALYESAWTRSSVDMAKRVPAAARDAGHAGVLNVGQYARWLAGEDAIGERLLRLWTHQGLLKHAPVPERIIPVPVADRPAEVPPRLLDYLRLDEAGDTSWCDAEPVNSIGGEVIYFLRRST